MSDLDYGPHQQCPDCQEYVIPSESCWVLVEDDSISRFVPFVQCSNCGHEWEVVEFEPMKKA